MTTMTAAPDDAHCVAVPAPPRRADGRVDLDRVAASLGPADLLESATGRGWSYVVPQTGARLVDDGRRTRLLANDGPPVELGHDPLDALDAVADRLAVDPATTPDAGLPPFPGGLVGAVAYDLARRLEQLPRIAVPDRALPQLSMRVAEVVVAVPPDGDDAVVVARPASLSGASPAERTSAVLTRLAGAGTVDVPPPTAPTPRPVHSSLGRDGHLAAVRAVQAAIAAGDAFQVNVTQRLTARWDGDASSLYRRLRAVSPAAYGAVLPDVGVASISPETFLEVRGSTVTSRPIKGTRPRHPDPRVDAALADDLATAAKDRAENVMIVDLQRNDLGRVCRSGSIRVHQLAELEAYPTVWHLVSTVGGQLRPGTGYGDLLRATFPCGSITGAPKIAAMELIDRLEQVRRGWYCGAIGFLGPGAAHLSVAIRTASCQPDGTVDYGAGGGIVADSDPAEEHAEALDKATAFMRAIGGTHVVPPPAGAAGVPGATADSGLS